MVDDDDLEGHVQEIIKSAWEAFKSDLVLYLLAGLLVAVVGGITLGILLGPMLIGYIELIRKRLHGKPATATDVFAGLQKFVPGLLTALVIGVAVAIGAILCVVPGLAVAWAAMFAFHFMTYENQSVGDCLKKSFELVKAHVAPTLILFVLIALLNGVGNAIALGGLLTFPFGMVAVTVAYEKLTGST